MINLSENIIYDETKSFLEQDENVQEFIRNIINNQIFDGKTEEKAGKYPRPLSYIWVFDGYRIIKSFKYQYPANHSMNGLITSVEIAVIIN